MSESADYVIVGAGSAGCVLADRLSADGDARVVLLEAGGPAQRAEVSIPAAYPRLFGTALDWDYGTTPQPGLGGRVLRWPRGKVLGGSSSLNAQIWTRGHRADYDGWAAGGLSGWGAREVLPYLRRAEDCDCGTGDFGSGGPLRIEELRDPSPATARFLAACAEAGIAPADPDRVLEPEGVAQVRTTQRNGRRYSAADGYLSRAAKRPNLRVITDASVRRVVIEGGRAVGVEYDTDRGPGRVRVTGEVILAAGAIGSPQLLMLSGIGDRDHLRQNDIALRHHLPAVGEALADHLYVPLAFAAREPVSPGVESGRAELDQYLRERRGRLTSNIAEALAFVRSTDDLPAPDLELVWMLLPFVAGREVAPGHGITLGVVLLQPHSTGRIRLISADPAAHPRIDPAYLSDAGAADLAVLMRGVRLAQRVLRQPALAQVLGDPLTPGALDESDAVVEKMIRLHAETLYHPVGTCRMGVGDDAVVDPRFRVDGIDGLRVVDASVLPAIPRVHTHAPTVMLAERAAEMIRADRAGLGKNISDGTKGGVAVTNSQAADLQQNQQTHYETRTEAAATLRRAFAAAVAEPELAQTLREQQLSLQIITPGTEYEVFLDAHGAHERATGRPVLRFELTPDTAHEIFLGRLAVPQAVVTRQLTVKGPVAQLRSLRAVLPALCRAYTEIAPAVRETA
ncbi:GMC family oxidoreductase [Nocardia macrotermitis]|uniref:Oxygen-dependent choline dehydrogenase n=1 Tax=Nocardia macrotermitis TaxID=2585198 RepID=A0A7K0DAB0_9NOCA|nr:GMC family oxidoreductase N-terminal domain-containing protein [Nocardia macrotermitis]MQY22608.1 Oxygen-dependent choline dehydrogenase [Nocardia macrotermitis]